MKYRKIRQTEHASRLLAFLFGAAGKLAQPISIDQVDYLDLTELRRRLEPSGLWSQVHRTVRTMPDHARFFVDRTDGRVLDWRFDARRHDG
ncbi:hypothetical protein ACC807_26555 [Rhizobium ruizarguesonis]|uniref:Uncharacterized protein n=1 Tax=Rhizobium ruizarguesonis TaxID=2081791 RepID=A0AB38I4B2_9HYPH|nr:hypothetical protein [Rhizobium ruizarguesonis]TBB66143.1 hypothetical protein ELH42_08190 [Rhizobium ruizarguesonis]TBB70534.1 hypothetical protein ELH45_08240 [Rhizobium ruizarguesonis]TBC15616.1 hypothetical protein ELH40_12100 [Rhizobium ruizarguesonis]TBY90685.1 hypothetical protein E0H40_14110 [Rhizobium leguminosarum bv. viciae]